MFKTPTRNSRHNAANHLYSDIEKIKAILAETTSDVKGKATELLSDTVDTIKEKSAAAQDNVSYYVHKKPLKSLGIAMLAGLIMGILFRRRSSRR